MSYAKARTITNFGATKKSMNKYGITVLDAMKGYALYHSHYNSNPYVSEERTPLYTFFGDMLTYFPYYSGEALMKKIKKYEQDMLQQYCKHDPDAFEIMIDSLNLLGWVLYEKIGGERDELTEWLFGEYERLLYRDWKDYVSEEEHRAIYRNLN